MGVGIKRGKENNKAAQRMEAAIKHKNMEGGKRKISLAIDATKVAQVLEVLHGTEL